MLAISKTLNYYYCVEWVPSENGPKILKYKKFLSKEIQDFPIDIISKIVKRFKPTTISESNSVSFSINEKNVGISSINVDPQIDKIDYIKWYEDKILGKYFVSNYYTYYYPMKYDNTTLLMIHLKKEIKDNVLLSAQDCGYRLDNFGIDIFSANELAAKYSFSKQIKNYLLWKIDNNNHHYCIYNSKYNNSFNIDSILKFKININKSSIDIIYNFGCEDICKKILKLINEIFFEENNRVISSTEQILLYQTKKDISLIKNLDQKNILNFDFLDISKGLFNEFYKKNKFEFLCYSEIGNSFRGIDV